MQDILRRINKIHGVRGTLIVGSDGLIIASEVAGDTDPQALGALASSVGATLTEALRRMDQGAVSRFVMNGVEGSAVLMTVQDAMLLTLVRKDANMGMVLVELKGSAADLAETLAGGAGAS